MNMKSLYRIAAVIILSTTLGACSSLEWSGNRIDHEADEALLVFKDEVRGGEVFLDQAAGYLVFPRVLRAGLGVGAETGEGSLRIGGKTVDYFRITSGSIGFQAGAQARSIVIAFMTKSSLEQFRNSNGWRVGIDGSVALIDIGAGKTIDSQNIRDPVVGFIFGSAGLMYNLTLEGTRFTRITRE
ncbi:MAG: YSC84-related protein [Gammaproteobacteria bacterium]|nr:YSC84-related protein [Gammaproteobacteria bacterium]MDH3430706.1 YSC84-related protein [Gammaproteobacteria bacterium]MDH3434889.1 YSC84-related protein [Gammaproteobacteria bacterium]